MKDKKQKNTKQKNIVPLVFIVLTERPNLYRQELIAEARVLLDSLAKNLMLDEDQAIRTQGKFTEAMEIHLKIMANTLAQK